MAHTIDVNRPYEEIHEIRFSRGAREIAVRFRTETQLWRLSDGRLTDVRKEDEKDFSISWVRGRQAQVSPGGRYRAVWKQHGGNDDNRHFIELQQMSDGRSLHQLDFLPSGSYRLEGTELAFSPDGTMLLGFADGQLLDYYQGIVNDKYTGTPTVLRLWRVADGRLLFDLRETGCCQKRIAFAPDSKTFAFSNPETGGIRLWRIKEQSLARQPVRQTQHILSQYNDRIRATVQRNWQEPFGVPPGLSCVVRVRVQPGGEVTDVKVERSSGNDAFDRSALAAIRGSAPLPVPTDSNMFEPFREFNFKFGPDV